ncbi:MAG: hypothetical protein LIP00_00745 [Parabacteroides sp.]|nr:hypothetical protein [Parabacteroides sp.]
MKLFIKLLLLTSVFLTIACSHEEPVPGPDEPIPPRELRLTLKNRFLFAPAAGTDASLSVSVNPENELAALDIFVFGSVTAAGPYTYRERFAYRKNPETFPSGATAIQLAATGENDACTTTSLSLRNGLFVKLYCIANLPALIDPADETVAVADTAFVPLQTRTGAAGVDITEPGRPSETEFLTFHTPLLDATAVQDTLTCPIGMAGAYAGSLDFTGLEENIPYKAEIRLIRPAARLDIRNNTQVSGFFLETVSVENGRKGSSLFPALPFGRYPEAGRDELIAYPARSFTGTNANAGLCTGAFYFYPSFPADNPLLVLQGKYRPASGPEEAVTYRIPFRQQADGNPVEITNNRRYTLSVTGSDSRQLYYVFHVDDWKDDDVASGSASDPAVRKFDVTIPPAFEGETRWDPASATLSLAFQAGSGVTLSAESNSVLLLAKTYASDNRNDDWLAVSEPTVTAATKAIAGYRYTYTLSLDRNYRGARYPKAKLRFTDTASGNESELFVESLTGLQAVAVADETNPNRFDAETQTVSLFRFDASSLLLKLVCADGAEAENIPEWLQVETVSEENGETLFRLTLIQPYVAEETGMLTFRNKARPQEIKTDVAIRLLDAVTPSFASLVGTENLFTPATAENPADVCMLVREPNVFTIEAVSMKGADAVVGFGDGPAWLAVAVTPVPAQASAAVTENITFNLVPDKLAGARTAAVTLQPRTGAVPYRFTVTPSFSSGKITGAGSPVPAENEWTGSAVTMYKPAGSVSTLQIRVVAYGGSKLAYSGSGLSFPAEMGNRANEAVYTLTAVEAGTGTLRVMNYSDNTKFTDYPVTVLLPDDPAIHVPAGTVEVLLEAGAEADKTAISSAGGFTVNAADIQWGAGGTPWFDLTVTDAPAGTDQRVGIRVKNGLASVAPGSVKEATVVLKNKVAGGGDASFTVTPLWPVPENADGQPLGFTVNTGASAEIRIKQPFPYGGIQVLPGAGVTVSATDEATGIVSLKGTSGGMATVKVCNAQDNTRCIGYTVSVNTLPADRIMTVGGMKWATGNLVRQDVNSCTIGEPADAGLYFKWGGLLGYDAAGAQNSVVTPNAYVADRSFAGSPYTTGNSIGAPAAAAGTGDPCTYYLGEGWRLPTPDEYRNSLGGGVTGSSDFTLAEWSTLTSVAGMKLGPAKELFFPAAGRYDGSVSSASATGYYWTGEWMSDRYAFNLYFNYVGARISNGATNNACPVRCVNVTD